AAVVDLVVDRVEDLGVAGRGVHAEGGDRLLQSGGRELRPEVGDLRRRLVPALEKLVLGGDRGHLVLGPLPGHHPAQYRRADGEELLGELAEGAHPAEREGEELILGERLDHAPRQATVALPVFEQLLRREGDRGGGSCGHVGLLSVAWFAPNPWAWRARGSVHGPAHLARPSPSAWRARRVARAP